MGNLLSQGLRKHKDVQYAGHSMPHLWKIKLLLNFK